MNPVIQLTPEVFDALAALARNPRNSSAENIFVDMVYQNAMQQIKEQQEKDKSETEDTNN